MLTEAPVRAGLPAQPDRAFPLVMTDKLAEVRAFYVDVVGCTPTFDLENYLQVPLTPAGTEGPELCFMRAPAMGPTPLAGGFVLSIPVGDADVVEARFRAAGVEVAEPTSDKPWGWRSLNVRDPAGVVLDFFHVLGENPTV